MTKNENAKTIAPRNGEPEPSNAQKAKGEAKAPDAMTQRTQTVRARIQALMFMGKIGRCAGVVRWFHLRVEQSQ